LEEHFLAKREEGNPQPLREQKVRPLRILGKTSGFGKYLQIWPSKKDNQKKFRNVMKKRTKASALGKSTLLPLIDEQQRPRAREIQSADKKTTRGRWY